MSFPINPDELEEIVDMGISHDQAVKALKLYKTKQAALNHLFPSPSKPSKPIKSFAPRTSIDDLNLAIQYSLKEQNLDLSLGDISNPESQLRFDNSPVGLKNIKNTCYFNSLIQSYFMIPKLVQEILSFKLDPNHPDLATLAKSPNIKLIEELQLLFASMILGNKKCIDPSNVLDTLLDETGKQIQVGEQKDIGEFNINFIARIEEGLKAAHSFKAPEGPSDLLGLALDEEKRFKKVENLNLVSQLFYAKQQEFVTAEELDGEQVEFKNCSMFGQLSLDVNEKDLHRAWDKAYHNFIEEYMTPRGHKTFATQDIWPEKLPGILLFQIQRVVYDPSLKVSVKINSEFKFPDVLYGDRYVLQNKETYLNLRHLVLEIKQKINVLERELKNIQNFKGSGCGIVKVLEVVSRFLDTQQYSVLENKKKQISHLLDIGDDELKDTQFTLEAIKKLFESKEHFLIENIERLQVELESIFDKENLKKFEYLLHAILMHQGRAEAGHYFAYIFDIEEKVWRSYSDTYIKKVTSEEVFKNAIGNEDISAYCLIYIYKPYIENSGVFSGSIENLLENYAKIIPDSIKNKVLESNDQFLYEIDSFKNLKIVEKIKRLYDDRFTQVVHWGSDSSFPEKQLINLVMFLRLQRNENLARLTLLQLCVHEVTGKYIESFKNDLIFIAKLEDVICKNQFGPVTLEPNENDKVLLQELKARYKWKLYHARLNSYIFDRMTEENLLQALTGLMHQLNVLNDPTDEYQRFCLENLKVIALRFSSYVDACFFDKEIEQGLTWAKHLAFVSTVVAGFDREFTRFIKARLESSLGYLKKYIPGYYSIDVKENFVGILESIDKLTAVMSFEADNSEMRLREIVKSSQDFNEVFAWREYSVGNNHSFLSYKNYCNSFIYDWTVALRRMNEKGIYLSDEVVNVERKNGIINKFNW